MIGDVQGDDLMLSKPLVLLPKLGEPGSSFFSLNTGDWAGYKEYAYLSDARILMEGDAGDRARVIYGSQKLVTANLKNLSKYLTTRGFEVKAWSFFSGELPGADMIFQAKQEPDDVLELAGTPSMEELYLERADEAVRVATPIELWSNFSSKLRDDSPTERFYLVDDWLALQADQAARPSLTNWGHDSIGAMLVSERTRLFAGVRQDTQKSAAHKSLGSTWEDLWLDDFEGYTIAYTPLATPSFAGVTTS